LPKAPTAASGVRKLGMLASVSTERAAPTAASPIQQVSKGLESWGLLSATACAAATGSPPILGEWMTSRPSMPLSRLAASMAAR